jgi:3-oxoacyl-[acyl-carrier protein] reductase
MPGDLDGRVALVCAASRGLGRAAAASLAAEGAAVAMCARRADAIAAAADAIARETGASVVPIVADLSRPGDPERVVAETVRHFGGLDVLVTNTGGPPSAPFMALTDEHWQAAIDSLLLSVVRLCRAAVPPMRARGGGRIIHITSVTLRQPVEGLMLSNAVRGALAGFTKTLATELGPDRILVNNVAPGFTRTERVTEIAEAAAAREGVAPGDVEQRFVRQVPMGRLGEPHELANLIAFLASDRGSYITGSTIQVDGGFVRGVF